MPGSILGTSVRRVEDADLITGASTFVGNLVHGADAPAGLAHVAFVRSPVAHALLTDWDNAVERFGKVMPKDYKRVLLATENAEREGRDVNQAIMEAAHG